MTTAAARDGARRIDTTPKKPTPEAMIDALRELGYQVELPVYPPYIEDMAKVLVDAVLESKQERDLRWRIVAAKLNENNWRPIGRDITTFPAASASAATESAIHASTGGGTATPIVQAAPATHIPTGRIDGEGTIIAPQDNMLNLEGDPSLFR